MIGLTEKILVVPGDYLREITDGKPGLHDFDEKRIETIIDRYGEFRLRDEMEHNPAYKQIIPYIAMYNTQGDILTLVRTKSQSERRLHNMVSLGVGGHVNDQDSDKPLEAYKKGMQREIDEEVDVTLLNKTEFLGVIYDETTDVGSVHLGMAFKVMIDFNGINEKDKFEHSWKTPEELKEITESMEGWSVHILEKL